MTLPSQHVLFTVFLIAALLCGSLVRAADPIVFKVVMVENEDPAQAGKAAAAQLRAAMGNVPLQAVFVSECYVDREFKSALLAGVCSELPKEIVFGGATYGSFTQEACTDYDAVCLAGFGGPGLHVAAELVTDLGTSKLTMDTDKERIAERLHKAGADLAARLPRSERDRLLVLFADAHSPKNQFLVEGVQRVLGTDFPITGGCANKNDGQTFVYYRGEMHADSALGLLLSGDFRVSLSGRQANVNEQVIETARTAAQEALTAAAGDPLAVLAFNCAGRRSKLKKYEDELTAIQDSLGRELPLFGCYCAGEIGPVDDAEARAKARCGGSGWHVMFTVLSRG